MKKLSFFSIPRNKTRRETIEVIKNALIANGWKFVEKSEPSKNKSWVRAEKTLICNALYSEKLLYFYFY